MPLKHLLLVLRARIWLVIFVAVATVVAGTYFTLNQPKLYTGTAVLLLNFSPQNPFEDSRLPPQLADSYVATQVDIITSRNVARGVVDRLGLADTPEARSVWVDVLLEGLEVETARESRVVMIHYTGDDPELVADVANAFAYSYADTAQRLAVEPARRNTEWFDSKLEQMRVRLEEAQSRMTAFQQQKGIVALDEKLDTETTRLSDLSNQLVDAQAEVYDVRSRQLGVNHPDFRRAIAREQSVQASLEEQKEKVLALKKQRDGLGVLAREVSVEQEAYESALQAYYQEQLQSSLAQTSIEVVDEALPPSEPSSPDIALNFAGSLMLGLMLAGLVGVGSEFAFRKIRTPEDVDGLLEGNLLARV